MVDTKSNMRFFDIQKIIDWIDFAGDNLLYAAIGIDEDWEHTNDVLFVNNFYTIDLLTNPIMACNGYGWGTPVLELAFKDGITIRLDCFDQDS